MERLNKIFADWAKEDKTELASQKVELGAIQDLRADLDNAKDTIDFVTDMNSFLDKAKQIAKNGKVTAESYIDRIKERENKVRKQIKDLGLDESSVKEFKEVNKIESFLNSLKKDFDRVLKINN